MLHDSWILAFAVTVLVELLVALVVSKLAKVPMPWSELLILNLITHPLAFVLMANNAEFAVVEIGVIVVEVVGYRLAGRLTWPQALSLGVLCNLVSLSLSFL
ncbi:MAG: RsiW-degrading membrane proteinase PrsW (M82 family) [Planctomycetota bacterium]|jgi:RsiW-degrading membrane proteinase PrsW (M82 family)